MLMDSQTQFSSNQAITATANSTNVIDTNPSGTNPQQQIGAGQDISLFALITAAFAGGTSLDIKLVSADDAGLTTNLITHYDSGAILTAALTAKSLPVALDLPYGKFRRYVGLVYTVVGGPMTAGTITAGLVEDLQVIKGTVDYAKGYTA